jgi:hypothetical protein
LTFTPGVATAWDMGSIIPHCLGLDVLRPLKSSGKEGGARHFLAGSILVDGADQP